MLQVVNKPILREVKATVRKNEDGKEVGQTLRVTIPPNRGIEGGDVVEIRKVDVT